MLRKTAKATWRLHADVPQRSAQRSAARIAASAATVALLIAGCAAPRLSSAPLPSETAGLGTAAPGAGQPGVEIPPQTQPKRPVQVAPAPAPKSAVPKSPIPVRPAAPVASPAKDPAPRFLTVAGTTINMPIVEVGVSPDGAMEIPEPFNQAGWYRFGPAPGAAAGTAVVAAHVDTTSESAPFSQLKSLPAGSIVTVQRHGAAPLAYRVIRVELMAKDAFDGASVFRRDGPPQLKLVTCGGRWLDEQQDYGDNVIVTAVPA